MLQGNSAKILLISLSAPPGISNTPFPPVAILFKTDSQKEMRLSVFAQKTKFCSPTAIIKSWMLTWCWEQVLHRNTPPRADCTELLLLLLPLLTHFFLERQLKCKRQCFYASAPSRRKRRICKPQTELFWPRPLQCKVQTLLLRASVQGLWWKQQHITFPFHCFSINLCSSPPRQAKPSYLLLLHHRVSYFLHSLQTIAMMIKTCEHPLSPWPFGFHTTLMGMKRKDLGENRCREVNKSAVTDSELCFLCIPSFNTRANWKEHKDVKEQLDKAR